ncbi:MAG: DUF1289 domain-containing protein [Pseudomonadota bacterium]|nr:DUF1289 domain-containing protein [Pseudomonadota bacterium]
MSNAPAPPQTPALTPCIGTCRLDSGGLCVGCQRTGEEIGRWSTMSDAERLYVMQVVLPERKSS